MKETSSSGRFKAIYPNGTKLRKLQSFEIFYE